MPPVRIGMLLLVLLPAATLLQSACDHGLTPPDVPPTGTITARIHYERETWPAADSILDLRFVALRFVPQDITDFAQLNRFVFSPTLQYGVDQDLAIISNVEPGPFLYSGVAWKFGPQLFNWKPVGLVEENDGIFVVRADETTSVSVRVDFSNLPPFPPEKR